MTSQRLPAASEWIRRWSHLVGPGATVLDVACGRGRHLHWFARHSHPVVGVDRDGEALAGLAGVGELVHADIEQGPWPFSGRQFGAVVVTNYLWRPLLPNLLASVAPGGVLLYETFAVGNASVGRPANPAFLLEQGELLRHCADPDWQVVGYEDGFLAQPARFVQRIAAVRCRTIESEGGEPPRWHLPTSGSPGFPSAPSCGPGELLP